MVSVGAQIMKLREARGLSRSQLAKLVRSKRLYVWRIETGVTRLLADELPAFARALDVPIDQLFPRARAAR